MAENLQTTVPDRMYEEMVEAALAGEQMTDAELARHYIQKGLRETLRGDAAVDLDV
jgi:hypothetical protein